MPTTTKRVLFAGVIGVVAFLAVLLFVPLLQMVVQTKTQPTQVGQVSDNTSNNSNSGTNPVRDACEANYPLCDSVYPTEKLLTGGAPKGGPLSGWPLPDYYAQGGTGFVLLDFDRHRGANTSVSGRYAVDVGVNAPSGVNVSGFVPVMSPMDGTVISVCDKEDGCTGMQPYGAHVRLRNSRLLCLNQADAWINNSDNTKVTTTPQCENGGSGAGCSTRQPDFPVHSCLNKDDANDKMTDALRQSFARGEGGSLINTKKVNYEVVLAHLTAGQVKLNRTGESTFTTLTGGMDVKKGDQLGTLGTKRKKEVKKIAEIEPFSGFSFPNPFSMFAPVFAAAPSFLPDLISSDGGELRITIKRGSASAEHLIYLYVDRGNNGCDSPTSCFRPYPTGLVTGSNTEFDEEHFIVGLDKSSNHKIVALNTKVELGPNDRFEIRMNSSALSRKENNGDIFYGPGRSPLFGPRGNQPRVINHQVRADGVRFCGVPGGAGDAPEDISDLYKQSYQLFSMSCWEDATSDWDYNDLVIRVDFNPDADKTFSNIPMLHYEVWKNTSKCLDDTSLQLEAQDPELFLGKKDEELAATEKVDQPPLPCCVNSQPRVMEVYSSVDSSTKIQRHTNASVPSGWLDSSFDDSSWSVPSEVVVDAWTVQDWRPNPSLDPPASGGFQFMRTSRPDDPQIIQSTAVVDQEAFAMDFVRKRFALPNDTVVSKAYLFVAADNIAHFWINGVRVVGTSDDHLDVQHSCETNNGDGVQGGIHKFDVTNRIMPGANILAGNLTNWLPCNADPHPMGMQFFLYIEYSPAQTAGQSIAPAALEVANQLCTYVPVVQGNTASEGKPFCSAGAGDPNCSIDTCLTDGVLTVSSGPDSTNALYRHTKTIVPSAWLLPDYDTNPLYKDQFTSEGWTAAFEVPKEGRWGAWNDTGWLPSNASDIPQACSAGICFMRQTGADDPKVIKGDTQDVNDALIRDFVRKKFYLPPTAILKKATLYLSSDNIAKAWVNQKPALGDSMKDDSLDNHGDCGTPFDGSVSGIRMFDVTQLVVPGENVLGINLLNLHGCPDRFHPDVVAPPTPMGLQYYIFIEYQTREKPESCKKVVTTPCDESRTQLIFQKIDKDVKDDQVFSLPADAPSTRVCAVNVRMHDYETGAAAKMFGCNFNVHSSGPGGRVKCNSPTSIYCSNPDFYYWNTKNGGYNIKPDLFVDNRDIKNYCTEKVPDNTEECLSDVENAFDCPDNHIVEFFNTNGKEMSNFKLNISPDKDHKVYIEQVVWVVDKPPQ